MTFPSTDILAVLALSGADMYQKYAHDCGTYITAQNTSQRFAGEDEQFGSVLIVQCMAP